MRWKISYIFGIEQTSGPRRMGSSHPSLHLGSPRGPDSFRDCPRGSACPGSRARRGGRLWAGGVRRRPHGSRGTLRARGFAWHARALRAGEDWRPCSMRAGSPAVPRGTSRREPASWRRSGGGRLRELRELGAEGLEGAAHLRAVAAPFARVREVDGGEDPVLGVEPPVDGEARQALGERGVVLLRPDFLEGLPLGADLVEGAVRTVRPVRAVAPVTLRSPGRREGRPSRPGPPPRPRSPPRRRRGRARS